MRRAPAPGPPLDPAADERFAELAALLARGLRALRDRASASAGPGPISAAEPHPDSCPNCLEVPGDLRLTVHTG